MTVDEPCAWGSPIIRHFGHQIADFSTRLLETSRLDPGIIVAVSPKLRTSKKSGKIYAEPLTPYFEAILDWYDIARSRVRVVDRPWIVRELWVAPQSEQLCGDVTDDRTLDALDEVVARKFGAIEKRQEPVFVSRSLQRSRLAGEVYLDKVLAAQGVRVVHPETLPLRDQLSIYAESDLLIFSEGSAVHGTQLLGRSLGAVHVLNRRPGARLAEANVRPRARSLEYFDPSDISVFGVTPAGNPAPETGLSIPDSDRLIAFFEHLGIHVSADWREDEFSAQQERDLLGWLEQEAGFSRSQHPAYWPLVREKLAALERHPRLRHLQSRIGDFAGSAG